MAKNPEFVNALAEALKKLGTVRAVGDQWVSVHGIIPKGGIPYCGQEVSRETYSALWQWANDNGLVIAESDWQALNSSQAGNVPKYSTGDGSSTFRMPKITGYIKCADSLGGAGAYIKEGLPNIVGTSSGNQDSGKYLDGAFALKGAGYMNSGNNAYAMLESFDASRCSSIYGNSAHVTPETMTVVFGVYAFGEVTNVGSVDLQSLARQLNTLSSTYLPLTGGQISGALHFPTGNVYTTLSASVKELALTADGGGHYGSVLTLRRTDDEVPGSFGLITRTSDGGMPHNLWGHPNGWLWWTGSMGASVFQATSDSRLKEDIADYSADMSSFGTYRYTLKSDGKKHIGLIAQEVMKVIPEAVSEDEDGHYSLDYNAIVAVLVGKVNELESRLKKLEG